MLPPISAITERDGGWVPSDLADAIAESLAAAGIKGLAVSTSWPAHIAVDRELTEADIAIAQDLADWHWKITIRPDSP